MQSPTLTARTTSPTYFELNNQLNIPKDGQIQLDKDKDAVRAYFLEYVNPNTVFFHDLREKLDYLLAEDYLEEAFLADYSFDFIKQLFQTVYAKKFRFQSFMGAYKFYKQYALKTNDGERILERYEDRIALTALYLAEGEEAFALQLAEEMITQRFQPATPTFMNAGRKRRGELASCYEISLEDNMNSIGRSINSALQLSRIGGGVGINLSNLRAKNDPIKKIENAAGGVVPVMKLFEDSFSYANQLGQRNGSGVAYLSVFHPDIVDFLATRKENADEKVRIKTLSLGLVVPDKFYELIKTNQPMYLFSPYDVERIYGKPFSYVDITAEYDNLVEHPEIRKAKLNARELETEISNLQNESGYPYIINIDAVNRANPVHGKILMSNLCTEIFQVMTPSVVNDEQGYDEMGTDVICNLGSTNVANLMASEDFGQSVKVALRALSIVSEKTETKTVPTVNNGNQRYHAVGLGAMNLHGFFAKNEMHYGSPESIEFTDLYFLLLNYWTLVASNELAAEKGSFYEFEKSDYATGAYFERYLENILTKETIVYEKNKSLFTDIFIPSLDDWYALQQSIHTYGLYNAYRQAIAPTGSISYVNEATASLHPLIQKIEERTEGSRGKVYSPAPYLSAKTIPYYTSAYDIDQRRIIDVYAAAQKHIDQGMSLTLFTRSEFLPGMYEWKTNSDYPTKKTTRDLNKLRNYAWTKDIKSLYYVRTFTDDGEIGSVNECASCSI